MINLNLSVLYQQDESPGQIFISRAGEVKTLPNLYWLLTINRSKSWGVEFDLESEHPTLGFHIAGFGISLMTKLYRSTGQPDEDYVSMVVYPSSSRPPLPHELEPKLGYCWWWNSHKYAWEYADCRHCDLSIYTHFMDWRAIPYPGVTHV